MSSGFSPEEAQALLKEVDATSQVAREYAHEALALSRVQVEVQECLFPFEGRLPDFLQDSFRDIGSPAHQVTSLDMGLVYDRGDMLFTPHDVQLHLDNNFTLRFTRLPPSTATHGRADLFFPQVLTPHKTSAVKAEDTRLLQQAHLYELLQHIGIDLPTSPQRAEWDAIEKILRYSGRWFATAEHRTQIPNGEWVIATSRMDGVGMNLDLLVEERAEPYGKNNDTSAKPVYECEAEEEAIARALGAISPAEEASSIGDRVLEIIIGLERPPRSKEEYLGYTATCLQLVLRSDDEFELPHFASVNRVPVKHEPEFLGGDTLIRSAAGDEELLLPNAGMLRRIRKAINAARAEQDT